jgi:GNAT superfamily N-acetyltransferase
MTPADIALARLTTLDTASESLRLDGERHGIDFVRRLFADWVSGTNRFDQTGERLLGAWNGGLLVGIGGLNRDPYAVDEEIGRLRHVYVLASHRRLGVGTLLVRNLLREAEGCFRVVRLRAASAEAAAFYRRLGFSDCADPCATHVIPAMPLP